MNRREYIQKLVDEELARQGLPTSKVIVNRLISLGRVPTAQDVAEAILTPVPCKKVYDMTSKDYLR